MNLEELRDLKEHFEWLIEEQSRTIQELRGEIRELESRLDSIQKPFGNLTSNKLKELETRLDQVQKKGDYREYGDSPYKPLKIDKRYL